MRSFSLVAIRWIVSLVYFLGPVFMSCSLFASEVVDGLEVAKKVYDRYDGDDAFFLMDMKLINRKGKEKKRELKIYVKDYSGLNRTLIVFTSPKDIKGTAFLSIETPEGEDIQYLYLPDLGRPRRIVSSQKKNRFVNTDYTYEDMERRKPEKDDHKILKEDVLLGRDCYVLESVPKPGTSQYGKRVSWIDKESYLVLAVDFYDPKGKKVKEFRALKVEEIDGIWTITESVMHDLRKRHKTKMNAREVKYNQGLKDEIFTVRGMKDVK